MAPRSPTGMVDLQGAVELLEAAIGGVVVDEVPVAMAHHLVGRLARAERQVAAVKMALARRVTEAGFHEGAGARDPATYLAQASGTSAGRAKGELRLFERVQGSPVLARALVEGRISADQARLILPAAEADPGGAEGLVAAAEHESFAELGQRARRQERAARPEESQEEKERRAHEGRFCRTSVTAEGGLRLEARLGVLEGARVLSALDHKTAELLKGTEGTVDRVRADALVALCCGAGVQAEVLVRVDAAALVRGAVEGDETCEVEGLGPVSVRAARSVLGEGFFTLLVTDGVDVSTVTSTSRFIPRRVKKALQARDRCCVVPGCGARHHLEIDHWRVDFEKTGPTALDNLCRLCSVHHRQKTNGILVLEGGPGHWSTRPGPMAGRRPGEPMRRGGPLRSEGAGRPGASGGAPGASGGAPEGSPRARAGPARGGRAGPARAGP